AHAWHTDTSLESSYAPSHGAIHFGAYAQRHGSLSIYRCPGMPNIQLAYMPLPPLGHRQRSNCLPPRFIGVGSVCFSLTCFSHTLRGWGRTVYRPPPTFQRQLHLHRRFARRVGVAVLHHSVGGVQVGTMLGDVSGEPAGSSYATGQ